LTAAAKNPARRHHGCLGIRGSCPGPGLAPYWAYDGGALHARPVIGFASGRGARVGAHCAHAGGTGSFCHVAVQLLAGRGGVSAPRQWTPALVERLCEPARTGFGANHPADQFISVGAVEITATGWKALRVTEKFTKNKIGLMSSIFSYLLSKTRGVLPYGGI